MVISNQIKRGENTMTKQEKRAAIKQDIEKLESAINAIQCKIMELDSSQQFKKEFLMIVCGQKADELQGARMALLTI